MPTLLVTGASGFLGAHVAARAIARGFDVRAGLRRTSERWRLKRLAPQATIVPLDLDDSIEELTQALDQVDVVIHCAAYGVDYRQSDFAVALEVNVAGTMRLAAAVAARSCRLVHVGTSYEYGSEDGVLNEERRLSPTGIYGVTKAAASLAMQDFARRAGSSIVVVRPFSMYGPLEGGHKFVPLVMSACRNKEAVDLSVGDQERDYLYVGDVADACLALAVADALPAGEMFNVCSGTGISLRTLAQSAVAAVGGDPSLLRWGAKPPRAAESMRVVGDPLKLARAIGWHATTSLEEGMAATAAADAAVSAEETQA